MSERFVTGITTITGFWTCPYPSCAGVRAATLHGLWAQLGRGVSRRSGDTGDSGDFDSATMNGAYDRMYEACRTENVGELRRAVQAFRAAGTEEFRDGRGGMILVAE
jgi:hypothetical protein